MDNRLTADNRLIERRAVLQAAVALAAAGPASLPPRESTNLLAKYRVTTGAVELSRR